MNALKVIAGNPQVRRIAAEVGLAVAREVVRLLAKERPIVVRSAA